VAGVFPGRALVVSSRGLVRSAASWVLSSAGLTVHECTEVRAAVRHARRIAPKLVLADLDGDWDAVWPGGFAHWCGGLPGRAHVIALASTTASIARVPNGCQVLVPDASATALAQLVRHAIGEPVSSAAAAPVLTGRQRDVLALVARGSMNQEIARALLISTGTVKRHLHDAFTVLGARSRLEAVAFAQAYGLI
jgi:DNA-binding CsgD family transcriptional regulator